MLELNTKSSYRKSLKLCAKRGKDMRNIRAVIDLLLEGGSLPAKYRPHKLAGTYTGKWECHLEPDWLLIYTLSDTTLTLEDTGTHSDLF